MESIETIAGVPRGKKAARLREDSAHKVEGTILFLCGHAVTVVARLARDFNVPRRVLAVRISESLQADSLWEGLGLAERLPQMWGAAAEGHEGASALALPGGSRELLPRKAVPVKRKGRVLGVLDGYDLILEAFSSGVTSQKELSLWLRQNGKTQRTRGLMQKVGILVDLKIVKDRRGKLELLNNNLDDIVRRVRERRRIKQMAWQAKHVERREKGLPARKYERSKKE